MIDFTNLKTLTIPEGNVVKITYNNEILWEAPPSTATITYNLIDGVVSSNAVIEVQKNSTYSTVLSLNNNSYYWNTVTVTMNGETTSYGTHGSTDDITINIENITGDIVINVSCMAEVYNPANITLGYRYTGTPGSLVTSGNRFVTDFIPVTPGDTLEIVSDGSFIPKYNSGAPQIEKIAYYDSSKAVIGTCYASTGYTQVTQIDESTVKYGIGYLNSGAEQSYFSNIVYVRFCVNCTETATASHASMLTSIRAKVSNNNQS